MGVTITPEGHAGVPYKAGQFIWLNIGHSPFSLHENPFPISSAPGSGPDVSFVIKELGDFTSHFGQITFGKKTCIDGPRGTLTVDGRAEPSIALIAGGVSIAPMLGILRELNLTEDSRQAVLVYGNRTEDQIVFGDELGGFAKQENVDGMHVVSEPSVDWTGRTGITDQDPLEGGFNAEQFASWVFVLCGLPAMVASVEETLAAHDVSAGRIIYERFQYD